MMKRNTVFLACILALAACSSDDDSDPPLGQTPAEAMNPLGDDTTESSLEGMPPSTEGAAPEVPADDPPIASPGGSIAAQVITPLAADGQTATGFWFCADQQDMPVAAFIFFDNGTGAIVRSADADAQRISWEESPVGSLLLSVDSAGDSMIQALSFSSSDTFTATDMSIAGQSIGPATCDLIRDGQDDVVTEGPSPDEIEQGNGVGARQEAIDESTNEADGTESSSDFILSTIVNGASDFWSCQSNTGNAYSLSFAADRSGSVAAGGGSATFTWEATPEAAGLVLISLERPNDSVISGIGFTDANNFNASVVRFSDPGIESASSGLATCARVAR